MTCPFTQDVSVYVLGSLSATERLEFERHLEECGRCTRSLRELAGLPGLLGRVDASVLERSPVDEPVPATLLPALDPRGTAEPAGGAPSSQPAWRRCWS